MSRFSKAAAEKAGWRIVHEQEPYDEARGGGQQGLVQKHPGNYRAEKDVDTHLGHKLINEQADTMGLLLEKIAAYEAFQDNLEDTDSPPEGDASYADPFAPLPELKLNSRPKVATDKNDRDQADNETNLKVGKDFTDTVKTPKGEFSEHDYFGRRSDDVREAHEDFLQRQRDLELAKPIDPTATKGERNEEVTPQNFGPPLPAVEVELSKAPGGERTEDEKKVTAKSKPSDTEKEARKQAGDLDKGKAGSKEQPAVPTYRGSDSPPEDAPNKQLVEPPAKAPASDKKPRGAK